MYTVVEDVLAAVRGTSLTDLEVEWDGGSLRLRREAAVPGLAAEPTAPTTAYPDGPAVVRSPYVGIFHREQGQSYPEPGERVDERTPIGEVETLGIRNAVTPPVAGELVEVLVADHTPVEFGQALAVVRPGTAGYA
jgi:acetyl-CoA carboxylase biotin carboxyl carrier protein